MKHFFAAACITAVALLAFGCEPQRGGSIDGARAGVSVMDSVIRAYTPRADRATDLGQE